MQIQIGTEIRDMTADERANYDAVLADQAATVAAIEAAQQARASAISKLAALGLTDAEITALVGA